MTAHRRLVSLLAAVAAVSALSIAGATDAQAYTCPRDGAQTIHLNDGSASAIIYVSKGCSDGRSRFSGVVRDIKCDARSAYLELRFFNGNNIFPYRYEEPSARNGCNTESTFSYSSTNAWPNMRACVRAHNGGPSQSSGDCRRF